MPADGDRGAAALIDEIMALGLAPDRFINRVGDQRIVGRGPQRRPEISGVLLAEAHVKRAGAGDADTVAAFAEIMGERRDEADPPACFPHADIARRSTGAVVDIIEREPVEQARAQLRQRPILVEPFRFDIAERHHLNEGDVHAIAMRPFDEAFDFILIHALERDGVDLDGHSGLLRRFDALEHLAEITPAGDRAELRLIQRIERHIDPLDAAGGQLVGKPGQLRPIGGQRQLFEGAAVEMAAQRAEQGHDVPADERLSACDPELPDTLGHKGGAETVELFERQKVLLRQEAHILRHAIDTAEIAPIGDRDAQIAHMAAERIDQRRGGVERLCLCIHGRVVPLVLVSTCVLPQIWAARRAYQ